MQLRYIIFFFIVSVSTVFGQSTESSILTFTSLEEIIDYAIDKNVDLENNQIRIDQAKKDRLSALLGTIDVTGNLLSAQITNNTNLGVNLFPGEIFGGDPGTFREVEMGVQHNTNLTNFLDIKLYNPNGYNNLKLADINIEMADINNQVTIHNYQESLVASYFNIINLQKQIENTRQSLATSDSLLTIVKNKYDEGLIKQQDVNDTEVNHLKLQESENQLEYLLEQYYLSLKILMDLDEETQIRIDEDKKEEAPMVMSSIMLNELSIQQSMLQEKYAMQNLKSSKQAFLPTVSLQLSNSWNLYNTEFTPFSGNWINSNYIGLRLNVPVPNSRQLSNRINAEYELEIAANNTIKERNKAALEVESLRSEYAQALSQIETNKKVLALQRDTYAKNQNLYAEGIVSLDITIQSLNAVLAAEYDLTNSEVNQALIQEKININNNTY